jgi:outer membrane protein TolC
MAKSKMKPNPEYAQAKKRASAAVKKLFDCKKQIRNAQSNVEKAMRDLKLANQKHDEAVMAAEEARSELESIPEKIEVED